MTNSQLFQLCGGMTACATITVAMLNATLPEAGERPLAPSSGVALIGDCRVAGAIAEKDDKAYAELEIENPGKDAATVDFHYSVLFTPTSSPMMRMAPLPRVATNGHCAVTIPAGSRRLERIELHERPARVPDATNALMKQTSPAHWSLFVSREATPTKGGWGGVPPAMAFATNRLEKGSLVLASTPVTSRKTP